MPEGAVPAATTATSSAGPDAAPDAGPDASGAPPLSERRAGQLAESMRDFLDYSPRYVYPVDKMKEVDDTFLIVAGEDSAPIDQAADVVHATVQAMWSGPMVHRIDLAVRIWLFATRKKYEEFRGRDGPPDSRPSDLSFWDPNTRSIFYCVEGQGITGLQHEVLHPMEIEDLPRASYWMQEALPALMEAGAFVDGQLVAKPHFRLATLRTADGRVPASLARQVSRCVTAFFSRRYSRFHANSSDPRAGHGESPPPSRKNSGRCAVDILRTWDRLFAPARRRGGGRTIPAGDQPATGRPRRGLSRAPLRVHFMHARRTKSGRCKLHSGRADGSRSGESNA
jgi:hypothetical protein